MTKRDSAGPRKITSLAVNPSELTSDQKMKTAARLWNKYRHHSKLAALESDDLRRLEELVKQKFETQYGAVVGALVLLRSGEYERLHNWVRNLANRFPDIPDGSILWMEQMTYQSEGDLFVEGADDKFMRNIPQSSWMSPLQGRKVVDYLLDLKSRGLPYTSEGLGYAETLVDEFIKYAELSDIEKDDLNLIQKKIKKALKYFRPGGLFCVFAGKKEDINPELVIF